MLKTFATVAGTSVAALAIWTIATAQPASRQPTDPARTTSLMTNPVPPLGPTRPGQPNRGDERAAAAGEIPRDPLQALGHSVFVRECSSCHGSGPGNPGFERKVGTEALFYKYKGELPALLEDRTDLQPKTVALLVRQGVSLMAPFRKTEISDSELAALGAYLSRNTLREPQK